MSQTKSKQRRSAKAFAMLRNIASPTAATAGLLCPLLAATEAHSQEASQSAAVHAQATFVVQGVGDFASPYTGPNSLARDQAKETVDITLYAGVRPWAGGELWVNPEIDQGFGLSNTLGAAGFPSAEAYKVGRSAPYGRLQRVFFRQIIGLGGGSDSIEGTANQLAGSQAHNRLVLTLGKFGVGDVFDTNRYAHDPRGDFLNWSVVDTGSFDYAADAWGYSYGLAAEWYQGPWTLRLGLFNLSKVPNGEVLEHDFSQNQLVAELEHRHTIAGRAGALRVTAFRNQGRFGRFDEALVLANATGNPPNTALTRRPMDRYGIALNAEQEVTASLGLFARAGVTDGDIEPYDFTDIDHTIVIGGALRGTGWGRSDDTVGLAAVINAISNEHRRYLTAGGIGLLVGDGKLPHPADEKIVELYYAWRPLRSLALTADYQLILDPAYNRDRGPANVFALRIHAAM
jgi:high affinity Mn2+ porin